MKSHIVFYFFIMILLSSCIGNTDNSGQPYHNPDRLLSVEESFPIDGVVDFSKLRVINEVEIGKYKLPAGTLDGKTDVKWAVLNDDRDIYIVVEWSDDTKNCEFVPGTGSGTGATANDAIFLDFDNDGNGTFEADENKYYMVAVPNDKVISVDSRKDLNYLKDKTGNGCSFMKYYPDEKKYRAEFLLPLSGDSDENITKNTRFNITINDNYKPADNSGFFSTVKLDTQVNEWLNVSLTDSEVIARTPIPDSLQGLIVFVATGSVPTTANPSGELNTGPGEIYSFDPVTKIVKRITSNNVYETGVSLSRDRTKIVYMSSPVDPEINSSAWDECEIYTVNVDGTGVMQLTNNEYLSGHPAWSPAGDKIVYGSLNGYSGPHIMVMDADGSNKIDMTLLSDSDAATHWYDEMDPDWLPDGRIIFKTNRGFHLQNYNGSNDFRLQIALMDADGGNFHLQTTKDNVVDHDPIANQSGSYAVFERIHGNYNYLTVNGMFSRWTIDQVKLDGSGEETTLVDNLWTNWLPVYDPNGNYIVYFRDCGYVEARLMRLSDGKDLGRFISGITTLRYLDWK